MTFLELAQKVLEENVQPMSANEIWEQAALKGYNQELNSKGKTPWQTLYAQVYTSVKDKKRSPFAVCNTQPKRFYLRKFENFVDFNSENENDSESKTSYAEKSTTEKQNFLEKDLHPFLSYYAHLFQRCYTKTINHSRSDKRSFGEWVHPDMVGCVFPVEDWKNEVLQLSKEFGNFSATIVSYELKRELNFSNLRESFFQAVSNSSWANEGYLVAAKITPDKEFMSELTRLSSAFGIGVIKLDIEEPDSSEKILPPKPRETVDWETINKLTMNKDFLEFVKRVRIDLNSMEIRKEKYDEVLTAEQLKRKIKGH